MCIYCNDVIPAHMISEEQTEDGTPGVAVYVMHGTLTVYIDGDDWLEFSAPMNFCPMCGKKLERGGGIA